MIIIYACKVYDGAVTVATRRAAIEGCTISPLGTLPTLIPQKNTVAGIDYSLSPRLACRRRGVLETNEVLYPRLSGHPEIRAAVNPEQRGKCRVEGDGVCIVLKGNEWHLWAGRGTNLEAKLFDATLSELVVAKINLQYRGG